MEGKIGNNFEDAFELMKKPLLGNLRYRGVEHEAGSYISVYDQATERKLIRNGACLQSLAYIDESVFGFGDSVKTRETVEL